MMIFNLPMVAYYIFFGIFVAGSLLFVLLASSSIEQRKPMKSILYAVFLILTSTGMIWSISEMTEKEVFYSEISQIEMNQNLDDSVTYFVMTTDGESYTFDNGDVLVRTNPFAYSSYVEFTAYKHSAIDGSQLIRTITIYLCENRVI